MENQFNLSIELREKVLTIFLLELNQTSKVSPAEKYYFKNLNQLLQIDAPSFQRIKKESAAFRPPNPQDRVIDLSQFFKESLTTLNQIHSPEESEDILRYIVISMDCSSHFTLESLDQLFAQLQQPQQAPEIIEDESDFFTTIEDNSDFDIIEDPGEGFDFMEDESESEPALPPSVKLNSPQSIALPKSKIANVEDFDEVFEQETTDSIESSPNSDIEDQVESPSQSENINESDDAITKDEKPTEDGDEKAVKKSKFKVPKVSLAPFVPMLTKYLQTYSDLIIDKLKLANKDETAITHPKLRVLAAIIDTLFMIPLFIIVMIVTIVLATIGLGIVGTLLQMILSLIIIFYYYKSETSEYQGSIGKTLCRIKIVNQDNQVMTSTQALTRNLFKFSPMLVGNIVAIIMIVIPFGILGLLTGLVSIGSTIGICYAFFNKKRQGVHDILAKTYVIGQQHNLPNDLEASAAKPTPE